MNNNPILAIKVIGNADCDSIYLERGVTQELVDFMTANDLTLELSDGLDISLISGEDEYRTSKLGDGDRTLMEVINFLICIYKKDTGKV